MIERGGLAHPDRLPIPRDAVVAPNWPAQMVEMADHIGAYATLLLVDAYGGEYLYIPEDPAKSRLGDVIGDEKSRRLSHVYGRERLRVPTARDALRYARRQPVLAEVRAGRLTKYEAARMLGTTYPYVWHLISKTDEGTGAGSAAPTAARRTAQLDLFDE